MLTLVKLTTHFTVGITITGNNIAIYLSLLQKGTIIASSLCVTKVYSSQFNKLGTRLSTSYSL